MSSSKNLSDLRSKIDALDGKLLELLNERGGVAIEIRELKQERSFGVYDPAREREIENNLRNINPGPLPSDSVVAIFREIISGCRALQHNIKVAYLGPEGSFSHQAAFHEFGSSAEFLPVGNFEDVFDSVEKGVSSYGIVPVENSTDGSIGGVLDVFLRSSLRVSSEYFQRISHFLLSKSGNVRDIEVVSSIPPALGQCKQWLSRHMKHAEIREVASTARAAQIAAGDKSVAAVAGEIAASVYNLKVVASRIEDSPNNSTRFWIIARNSPRPTGFDKTSVVFSLKHEPGALQKALQPFSEAGINLTKIESRPSKERHWEYVFFADFDGHSEDAQVQSVLRQAERSCAMLKILGSYPKGKTG
ncbi:MAG: prephenate dehydratase [Deltaproteobacteria bacterium]